MFWGITDLNSHPEEMISVYCVEAPVTTFLTPGLYLQVYKDPHAQKTQKAPHHRLQVHSTKHSTLKTLNQDPKPCPKTQPQYMRK